AKFRFLVESISQQLWIADAQGHIEYVNQYTLNYLRCSTIENCGAKWLKMVHPEDRSKIRSAWNHAFRETNNYEVEFRLYDQASQTYRWHLGRAIPGYNQQNEIVNWFGTNTDIHNQVLAEISLETTKCPYESITAISPVGIFHTDILGNCDYVNDRWCEITGINRETALNMSWINTIHPEDQPRIEAEWYHHLQKHRPFRSKYRFKHSHSHVTWVVGQTVPEIGEDGKVIAYVGTITDISEDKQVEEALAQQLRLAEFHADIDTICIKDYAIYMLDTQGRVISWNSGAEYITGYTAPEIIGRDFSCFFVEED
ncbi:MAG: PAS domain S-box protein, partial [Sphaerospermopsis kisseleviana]